jgi:hypothetical protein
VVVAGADPVLGPVMSATSIILEPACQTPAHSRLPKRRAWCRRFGRPCRSGTSPPTVCWPGIHQRETSSSLVGSTKVIDDQDVAPVAVHLGRDVGIAFVHVDAMDALASRPLIAEEPRPGGVGDVVRWRTVSGDDENYVYAIAL